MKKYDSYKNSGFDFVDEVPFNWKGLKLKYCLRMQSGKGITNEKFKDNAEYNVYGGNGILGKTDDFSHEGEHLVIGRVGALCGNVRLVGGRKWISDNALVATTNQTPAFLEYSLIVLDLNRLANQNAQPLITGTMVKDQYISLPPIEEQTQIANYLDHKTAQLDSLISKKEQLIELLKEERTAVINQAVTKGLDPTVPMKDSGIEWLGEIPAHWESPRMKFITEFILDGTHGTHPREKEGYRLLSVRNIVKGEFTFREDDSRISEEEFLKITSRFTVKKDDIQLAIVGATLGKVAIVGDLIESIATQRSIATIRTNSTFCLAQYLHYFTQSDFFQSYLWLNTGFSAQPGVYLGTLQDCLIPLPSNNEQKKIVNQVKESIDLIDTIDQKTLKEILLLKEYKTALISEVVTGKVDVRDEIIPSRIN